MLKAQCHVLKQSEPYMVGKKQRFEDDCEKPSDD